MYSCGHLCRDEQRQDVQLEHTYSSSVPILDVAWKTCQKQWMIGRGGERGSGISMLIVRHDDDERYPINKTNPISYIENHIYKYQSKTVKDLRNGTIIIETENKKHTRYENFSQLKTKNIPP